MHSAKILVRPPLEQDVRRLAEIHIAAWRATYRGVMTDEYLDGMSVERAISGWGRNITNPIEGTHHLTVVQDGDPSCRGESQWKVPAIRFPRLKKGAEVRRNR